MNAFNSITTKNSKIHDIYIYTILVILTIICALPLYLMLIGSTLDDRTIVNGFQFYPGSHFQNNMDLIDRAVPLWQGFSNSLRITIPYTLLAAYFSALTAYGFSVYRFRFKKYLFGFVLATMMIPQQLGIIGYFDFCLKLGLVDTFFPLIITGTVNTLSIFFIKQYADQVLHPSLIEAARIDQATELQIFHTIALPVLTPVIATMSIFNFVLSWNNLMAPILLIFSDEKYPLSVLIASLSSGKYPVNLGATYLAITLSLMPIILIYTYCSKHIISGLTMGSVKE
ncbi:MAG: carbohydrate ABC transporter permease [Spirochaetes bacterium]|nr:carbohydrate ABC transporter permease [Spirochaetota bacterium]MBN2771676.1 carbohydrate ABC transporter permease [Spirochaetota bacterium]